MDSDDSDVGNREEDGEALSRAQATETDPLLRRPQNGHITGQPVQYPSMNVVSPSPEAVIEG